MTMHTAADLKLAALIVTHEWDTDPEVADAIRRHVLKEGVAAIFAAERFAQACEDAPTLTGAQQVALTAYRQVYPRIPSEPSRE